MPQSASVRVALYASVGPELTQYDVDGEAAALVGRGAVTFEIDTTTGEPLPIQHVDTRGIHCRTFHIEPSSRMLVAAHIMALPVREGAAIRTVPASLSVFRIDGNGKLGIVRKYDVDVGSRTMFWMGMVPLSQ